MLKVQAIRTLMIFTDTLKLDFIDINLLFKDMRGFANRRRLFLALNTENRLFFLFPKLYRIYSRLIRSAKKEVRNRIKYFNPAMSG